MKQEDQIELQENHIVQQKKDVFIKYFFKKNKLKQFTFILFTIYKLIYHFYRKNSNYIKNDFVDYK